MTEAEWLACTDPEPMLEHLRSWAGERKLLLFLCSCVGRLENLITERTCWDCIEVVERFVDARATKSELRDALVAAEPVLEGFAGTDDVDPVPIAATVAHDTAYFAEAGEVDIGVVVGLCRSASEAVATASTDASPDATRDDWDEARRAEEAEQVHLIRDIFDNPFRPVGIDPAWAVPGVVDLARTIYEDRAFDRMPELADALEGARCHDAEILGHCRQPGSHVRGCWVLDLLLGKS